VVALVRAGSQRWGKRWTTMDRSGHQGSKKPQLSLPVASRPRATHEGAVEFESPHPAAASLPGSWQRGAGHRAWASPSGQLEPLSPGGSIVGLAARATRVPQAAVTSGIQRTTTVTQRRPLAWPHAADLGDLPAEKLHGMQGVKRVELG